MNRKVAITLCMMTAAAASSQPLLNLQTGVELYWPTSSNNTYTYLPQWSPIPVAGWTALTGPTPGNGATNSLFDPAPIGSRSYRVLEMIPGSAPTASLPTNGSFESGTGSTANDWTVDLAAGGPVYGVRTNDNPHTGSFNFEVHLASTGAGPVVELSQSGVPVTGGTTYPFTLFSSALTGSAGYGAQWRILWNAGGDTGYQGFFPGTNTYFFTSNSVIAPSSATSATIFLHFAGAAIPSQSATIDIDDIALGSGSNPGSPGVTNILSVTTQPVGNVSFLTTSGTQYQPESTTNLSLGPWITNYLVLMGDGGTDTVQFLLTNNPLFFRMAVPPVVILPPSNLQQITSTSMPLASLDGQSHARRHRLPHPLQPGQWGRDLNYGRRKRQLRHHRPDLRPDLFLDRLHAHSGRSKPGGHQPVRPA